MSVLALILAFLTALSTPCPTEDSAGCTWDASTHGNGEGRSFVALENGADNDDAFILFLN